MDGPRRSTRRRALAAVAALCALVAAGACSGDDDAAPTTVGTAPLDPLITTPGSGSSATTVAPTTTQVSTTSSTPPTAWAADTTACPDASATEPIGDTVTIGVIAPQTETLASAVYAPSVLAFEAFIDRVNEAGTLPGITLEVVVGDDEGDADITPVVFDGLADAGADLVSAVIGTAQNLAARDVARVRCVPQLMALGSSPSLGDIAASPWTMVGSLPAAIEVSTFAGVISRDLGSRATVGLVVSPDDDGRAYSSAVVAALDARGLGLVAQHALGGDPTVTPSDQVSALAAARPSAVIASLAGPSCATFLIELAALRAESPEWTPTVYVGSSCASTTILRLAGDAANGVMAVSNLRTDEPTFVAAMDSAEIVGSLDIAAEGWNAADVTVAILAAAQASPSGLTRASIIEAARALDYTPMLARPGVVYRTNGLADPYAAQSLQLVAYDGVTRTFVDVGPLLTLFES